MSELVVADEASVQGIVAAYRDVVWPVPAEQERVVAGQLSWRLDTSTARGADYFSGMLDAAKGHSDVAVRYLDGAVSQVKVDLCNFSREHERKDMLAVRRQMLKVVAGVLGEPSGKQRGNPFWELENRGRVWVELLTHTVLLVILHPKYADIERREQRLGIPDDRIPGTGDESDYL